MYGGRRMRREFIDINLICARNDLQARDWMSDDTVADYAAAMEAGAVFPPLVVFWDKDEPNVYWLADGYHRLAAAKAIGGKKIEVEIKNGLHRDAVLYAASANAKHGLRRTNSDKRRAASVLLSDREWSKWSDREIGKLLAIDHKTIGKIRSELAPTGEFPSSKEQIVNQRSGSTGEETAEIFNASEKRLGRDGKFRRVPQRKSLEPESEGGQVFTPLELDGALMFEWQKFIDRVPKEKRHYVCRQLRIIASENDPEDPAYVG